MIQKQEAVTQGGGCILVPNFLSSSEIQEVLEYRRGYEDIQWNEWHVHRKKLMWPESSEKKAWLTQKLAELMASDEFRAAIEPWTDYSWRCIYNATPGSTEFAVSKYQPNSVGYVWHVDHADGLRRTSNVIINLNQVEGGELDWCSKHITREENTLNCPPEDRFQAEPEGTVLPIPGQLTIMPAHYPHRVRPSPDLRITLHGHLRL